MPPDLNTLPPSHTASSVAYHSSPTNDSGENNTPQHSVSPRSSISLAAAATMNAADLSRRSSTSAHRLSPSTTRRLSESHRFGTGSNINSADPSPLGFGDGSNGRERHRSSISNAFRTHSPTSIGGSPTIATGDPHHHQRTPSIGEIHQELEQEQEAQVNRLLSMIRSQQSQLLQMQQSQNQHQNNSSSGTAIVDDSTPTSERSWSLPSVPPLASQTHRGPIPIASARRGSRGSNHGISPGLIPVGSQPESTMSSAIDISVPRAEGTGRRGSRDDSFYQAETGMLLRENQMLKMRIRELERQVHDLTASSAPTPSSRLSQSISSADQSSQNLTMRPHPNATQQTGSQEQSDSDKP